MLYMVSDVINSDTFMCDFVVKKLRPHDQVCLIHLLKCWLPQQRENLEDQTIMLF